MVDKAPETSQVYELKHTNVRVKDGHWLADRQFVPNIEFFFFKLDLPQCANS